MNFEELEKFLQVQEQEEDIYIPNEVFEDLQNNISKAVHLPFAYTYYYLICWLYRYAKYGNLAIDNKDIKKILGYHQDTKGLDYIIKKGGVLDIMEYTYTTKDYPVLWTYEDEFLDFELLSEWNLEFQMMIKESRSRKYNIKYPIKSFYRTKELEDERILDGTFYEVENTHLIPFNVFLFCMSKKDIGCTGFYLWSYLKMKNQVFTYGYDVSMKQLAMNIGLPYNSMVESLKALRQYNMVEVIHNQEYFCLIMDDGKRKANTYKVNSYNEFADRHIQYDKMKVVQVNEYMEMKKKRKKQEDVIDIPLDMLPF